MRYIFILFLAGIFFRFADQGQFSRSENNPLAQKPGIVENILLTTGYHLVSSCLSIQVEKDSMRCINNYLKKMSQLKGARFGLNIIEHVSQKNPVLLKYSHDFSHTIGSNAIYYNYRGRLTDQSENQDEFTKGELDLINKIGKSLVDCDGWGAFGCYHGVIEIGLSRLPAANRTRVIRKACLENPLIQSHRAYSNQCLHWFGHGMAIFTDQTLNETLAVCEGLNPVFGSDDVQLCISGVFHAGGSPGSSDKSYLHNISRVYNESNVYFPCQDVGEEYVAQCYSHVPGRSGTQDMGIVFGNCDNIPEKDVDKKRNYVHRCYNSAANILLVNSDFNASMVDANCKKYPDPQYRKYCYEGAVRYAILRDPLLNNTIPFEICRLADAIDKPQCYKGLGAANYENYFDLAILEDYCKNVESGYQQDCTHLAIPD